MGKKLDSNRWYDRWYHSSQNLLVSCSQIFWTYSSKFFQFFNFSSKLSCLEDHVLGQWSNYDFSLVANVSWNGKHSWSKPLPNHSMSMCPVLKFKNITSWKYSLISTTSALQMAMRLTWGFFLVKTPMLIECLLLHLFLSWSFMIHISMKFISLSMQVMTSFPL